jgi:hypothetical protein
MEGFFYLNKNKLKNSCAVNKKALSLLTWQQRRRYGKRETKIIAG